MLFRLELAVDILVIKMNGVLRLALPARTARLNAEEGCRDLSDEIGRGAANRRLGRDAHLSDSAR